MRKLVVSIMIICGLSVALRAQEIKATEKNLGANIPGPVKMLQLKLADHDYLFEVYEVSFDFVNLESNQNDILNYYLSDFIDDVRRPFNWFVTETRGGKWPHCGNTGPRMAFFKRNAESVTVYCMNRQQSFALTDDMKNADKVAYEFLQQFAKEKESIGTDDSFVDSLNENQLLPYLARYKVIVPLTKNNYNAMLER
jgi:hypothetical protein